MDVLMRVVAMILLGYLFAYGEPVTQLGLLAAIWIAARQGNTRFIELGMFCAVALLPAAVAAYDYTGDVGLAVLTWLIPVAMNAIAIGLTLGFRQNTGLMTIIVLTLLSITPISGVSVISVWPLAGLLFPGTGWFGIALLTLLVFVLVERPPRRIYSLRSLTCALLSLAMLTTNAQAALEPVPAPQSAIGIDTWRGMPDQTTQSVFARAWRFEELDIAQTHQPATLLLPESVFGDLDAQDHRILEMSSSRIIGGARHWIDATHYVNVLIDASDGQILYQQRSPAPAFLNTRSIAVAGQETDTGTISALLCVELANTGLTASTYASANHRVIWAANLGWSKNRALYRRLVNEAALWSRLFAVPTVTAVNHPEAAHA